MTHVAQTAGEEEGKKWHSSVTFQHAVMRSPMRIRGRCINPCASACCCYVGDARSPTLPMRYSAQDRWQRRAPSSCFANQKCHLNVTPIAPSNAAGAPYNSKDQQRHSKDQQRHSKDQQRSMKTTAADTTAPPSILAQSLRRAKYYLFINAFICGVGYASHAFVSFFLDSYNSSSGPNTAWSSIAAVYIAGVVRIAVMVMWFDWIGTMKSKILGDKRTALTPQQRRSICLRILWLIVPTECISFWMAARQDAGVDPAAALGTSRVGLRSFPVEFALFIPKSLVFEVIFDFFHYGAHWLCHQIPWLYQHAHKRHHMHLHPCPLSTYEQDAVDLCLTNVVPFLLASHFGFSLSAFQLHLVFAYKTYVEVAGHCGLEVKGFSFPQFPWINWLSISLCVRDHDLHHTHPKFNFAKRFALWDKVFGTFRPGRRPLQE